MRYPAIFILAAAAFLAGCATLPLNPMNESRAVQAATDVKKTVTVSEGMVFYDSLLATHGLRFPAGIYALEAEDADYWYLRSPVSLEFRVFKDGKVVDERTIPGGIMIAKHFSMVPGGGYIDGEGSTKIMVWKLGSEFLSIKGNYWTKNF
jgi:hypothetical protein